MVEWNERKKSEQDLNGDFGELVCGVAHCTSSFSIMQRSARKLSACIAFDINGQIIKFDVIIKILSLIKITRAANILFFTFQCENGIVSRKMQLIQSDIKLFL